MWDWNFLLLIIASSLVDFIAGKAITATPKISYKKIFLWLSILWNLGVLFTFKYYDFFIENFAELFGILVPDKGYHFLKVVIPVGLSFYTFQTMSYTIDVYRGRIKATNNLLEFLCFVSFFPQLVAGPIERAKMLLCQFEEKRKFDFQETKEGLRKILWGLFKKLVVADNIASAVNVIYATPEDYGTLSILYASILFFFQIYCDFSGYSDIAIGTAKLFGFKLSENFRAPYLAKNLSEFWSRWHITLTQWFTDYLYKPLAYIKKDKKISATTGFFALLLTMTLIGFWHGATWTFILFGFFNGVILILERLRFGKKGMNIVKLSLKAPRIFTTIYVFGILTITSMLFRAISLDKLSILITRLFSFSSEIPFSFIIGAKILVIPVFILTEYSTRFKTHPFYELQKHISRPVRWMIYYALIFLIIRYAGPKEQFIYFQF
ncbi:alginate O-acetylation protein [unidentified eubacterium SCB49]|nr:alginate O-acetylation protein [unidentified eubacterium SCB49]